MKKIITISLLVLLLFSVFTLPVSALETIVDYEEYYTTNLDTKTEISFSENFKSLYFGKEEYIRVSSDNIYADAYADVINPINLSETQKQDIEEILITANEIGNFLSAEIYYKDGAYLSCTYMSNDLYSEYQELLTDDSAKVIIEAYYPYNNNVYTTKDILLNEDKIDLTIDYFDMDFESDVSICTSDESIYISIGEVVMYKGNFYYLDDEAVEIIYNDDTENEIFSVKAYKITNKELLEDLEKAEEKYNDFDYSFYYDDELTEEVSNVFLLIVFAFIPFALLVLFTILAIRSKKIYRKFNITIAALSAAELVIFGIIALILF